MAGSKKIWHYLVVSFIFSLFLLCVLFQINRAKAEIVTSGDWEYLNYVQTNVGVYDYQAITILRYNGSSEDVTIPSTLDGKPVKVVGGGGTSFPESDYSFTDENYYGHISDGLEKYRIFKNDTVKKVTIPKSVERIASYAFRDCHSLQDVVLFSGLKRIGDQSFLGCASLKSMVIPDSVEWIGERAFCECASLSDVKLPNGITALYQYTFGKCTSLVSIVIPSSVTYLQLTFYGCTSLETIDLPISLERLDCTFQDCSSLSTVALPNKVKIIDEFTFENCSSLSEITIPNQVKSIGRWAFAGCSSLKKVVFSQTLENISEYAFQDCYALKECVFPDSLRTIGDSAFRDCDSLEELVIPGSVELVDDDAFHGCEALESLVFQKGTSLTIGENAFAYCALPTVKLPDHLQQIGEWAFHSPNPRTVYLGQGITVFPERVFGYAKTIYIPKAVTSVGPGNMGFNDPYSQDNLEIYYQGSYDEFWHLVTNQDGSTDKEPIVKDILESGIADSRWVYHYNSYSPVSDSTNDDEQAIMKTGVLRKGDGWSLNWTIRYYEDANKAKSHVSLRLYLKGDTSKEPGITIFDENDTKSNGYNQPWLSSAGLTKDDILAIGIEGAETTPLTIMPYYFQGYSNLKTVHLNNVKQIGESAFEGCHSLSSVVTDSRLGRIDDNAFKDNHKLLFFGTYSSQTDNPDIRPDTVKELFLDKLYAVGDGAFSNTSISTLYFSPSLVEVGEGAFDGCNDLEKAVFNGSPSQWKNIKVGNKNEKLLNTLEFLNGDPYYVNGHKYDYNLDYYLTHLESSEFDNNLCHLMCDLACVAYDDDAPKAFTSLGFSKDSLVEKSFYGFGIFKDLKSYRINKKTTTDGNCIVLIDITGSHDILNPKSGMDWLTDFAVAPPGGNNYSYHNGFDELSSIVFDTLKGYLNVDGSLPSSSKTKYFITGHSLGAGVANLLAAKISSEVGKEDVYCYDFACPDTAITTEDPSRTKSMDPFNRANSRDNIFNICDLGDIVTYVPGEAGSALMEGKKTLNGDGITNFHFGKLGITMWFADGVYDRITVLAHSPRNYVEHLPNDYSQYFISNIHPTTVALNEIKEGLDNIKTDFVKVFTFCPVDMYLIDETGNVLASVEDNKPSLNYSELDILVMTSDDKACIIYPKKQNYSLKLIGTAAGKMTYVVGSGSGDNVNINEAKLFSDVLLEKGKTMISDPIEEGIDETNLYVTNEDETPFKEIHEDGTETKIGVTDLAIRSILVERDEDDFTVKPGASKQIKVVFKNADRDIIEKSATWTSSNEQIATVSPTGLVTAITEGSVTITVSVDDQSLDIPITVSKNADDTTPSTPTSPPSENNEPVREGDGDKTNDMPLLAGIVKGPDGKWAMYKNNKVDTSYTGIAKNDYGWWRVKNGYVDFKANGIYKNQYGWWKTNDGKVTFKETGVFKNEYGWWRVEDSKVNFKAKGIYKNQYGWWKTTDGKVTFKENGVFKNEYGWWKVKDSKVDFSFTGIAKNKYGSWYVKDGKVDFKKNGKVNYNNHSYIVKSGKVQ